MRNQWVFACWSALAALSIAGCSGTAEGITVGVAASLLPSVQEAAARFSAGTGTPVTLVSGPSGGLAQQVRAGAPLDALVLADAAYLEALAGEGLLDGSPRVFAHGVLVAVSRLAVPPGTGPAALARDPRVRVVAIANPASAPYGAAAVAFLREDGAWVQVEPRIVYANDVAGALALVTSGNAEVGFVSRSLVQAGPASALTVLTADAVGSGLDQAVGVVAGARQLTGARGFAGYLAGPQTVDIWERAGYRTPTAVR